MVDSEAQDAEQRERESDLETNGREEPLQEAAQNARRIYRGDVVARGVDGLAAAPMNADSVIGVIADARMKGIPVITLGKKMNEFAP